jgi:hypothetical protein
MFKIRAAGEQDAERIADVVNAALLPYYTRSGYHVVSYERSSGGAWNLSRPFQIVHMAKEL